MTSSEPAGARVATVRRMGDQDLSFAARLHAQALPHGFFGQLGPVFLRPYYWSFLHAPSGVALVAEVHGTPVGALVGTTRPAEHYRWVLRRHGARLGLALVLALLRSPRQLVLFLRTRVGRYLRAAGRLAGSRVAGEPACGEGRRLAVLMHVCVSPDARGSGAGTALVQAFCDAARAAGRTEVELVTLAGPEGASRFYDLLGWRRGGERLDHDGRPVRSYGKAL